MEDKKDQQKAKTQNILLENRKKLTVSGLVNVDSFNDEFIVAQTELGTLVIRGQNLHIQKLNLEGSELFVEGEIDACEYLERDGQSGKSKGLFGRMFK